MGFSVHWSWLAVFACLLCMGGEVWCDCTEDNMQIVGGHYNLTKQLNPHSMLIYHCPDGYYPYPAFTRLCQPDGTWEPAPKTFAPQRCRLVECPDPTVLENGHVFPPQEKYFLDNETSYECYSGYTLRGSSRRTCLTNGKWSGSTPICSRDLGDTCADPGIPAGASRTGRLFGIDDTVKYSCNGNLFLVGSSERVCQENGYWTGKEPACYYQHTFDTPMEVSEAFASALKNSLTTEPVDDRWGTRKIRITKHGLHIYIAVDISESIGEKHFTDTKNAVMQFISKISAFEVSPNYEILFFSSNIFEVVNIVDFWDGSVGLNTIMSQLANFRIDESTAAADLNLVFITFLERMAFIKQRVGEQSFREHRHILIIFTDGAYNMGGSPAPTVDKIKNMVYMNKTSEGKAQSRDENLDIYIFGIGYEIFDDHLQPLTVGTGGQHYFRMKDVEKLREAFDESFDEEEFRDLCGLHKEYKTADKDSKRKKYPWIAFINITNEGSSKNCMGSLVSPQFVLTAAHCFPFGVLPEHITVEIDDGQGRAKRVKTFTIHPNYNVSAKAQEGVKEFYDYDVALIQLDVQITPAVRPICIPCTQETSDALKLVGKSTCKQQEQLLLQNQLERLTFLTRTANVVDEKEVHAKLGDHRDACIRHALHAPGITTTNPKDPVTDNFLCTGGRTPYRDHIACADDGGGAVFKNYEHRTIQVALVSWGTKNLCPESSVSGMVESDGTSRDFHINLFRVVPFLKSILGNEEQDNYAPLKFLES